MHLTSTIKRETNKQIFTNKLKIFHALSTYYQRRSKKRKPRISIVEPHNEYISSISSTKSAVTSEVTRLPALCTLLCYYYYCHSGARPLRDREGAIFDCETRLEPSSMRTVNLKIIKRSLYAESPPIMALDKREDIRTLEKE